jgi:WXG100 family type VII secretion target
MSLELTPDQAAAHIRRVEDARDRAVAKLGQINDTQANMLSSGWQGNSATTYGSTSDSQNDAFQQIIQTLNHVVETGSNHMRNVSSNS